eukprot:2662709-Pyramimonas_sp.AAC.1
MIKVFGIEAFGSVVLNPSTTLGVYIDDSGLNSTGTADGVMHSLTLGAQTLQHVIAVMMRAQISLDKIAMVCSKESMSVRPG